MYCILRSLVEQSYINPKSLTFGYLDEKPIDIGLMKFLSLYPSVLSCATHDTDLPHQENEGACEQGGTSQRCLSGDRSQEGDSPRGPHGEGSNRWRDKAVSQPRSMRDLCRVRAHSQNEPFLTQEIADLPEVSGEGPLEVRWAMLTPRSKVWHHHFSMGLIVRVRESGRVVDELSQIIDELQAKVQKLKDKADPVAVAANEARANEATQRAKESHQ
ncbi:hypothetical protein BHE74_00025511 [Ensete ventricosum]|nr:hypothetical protein BHE74_00025511 [Ensete ventricosum]